MSVVEFSTLANAEGGGCELFNIKWHLSNTCEIKAFIAHFDASGQCDGVVPSET